jgi:carboxyl-terminal processing protease
MAFDNYLDGIITLEEVLDYTMQYHVSEPNVDQLIDGAIEGMLDTLNDPYTEYLSEKSLQEFTNSLNGEQYVGIGVRMQLQDDYPQIVEVFAGSPAQQAGLLAGDLIIAVDGNGLYQQPLETASNKILGTAGTKVTITVRRGEKQFEVPLTRVAVQTTTVSDVKVSNGIGYIDVNSFGENTPQEFAKALQQVKEQKAKGLIIDLRNNHGGYVAAAVQMASQFLPVGTKVVNIVEKSGEEIVYRSFGNDAVVDMPVVILMNEDSASASEIFAGALQDHGVAKLLGTQSYGKGKVQSVIQLDSGGALKITTGTYQLPGGRFIDGVGITPDKQVKSPGLQLLMAQNLIKPVDQIRIKLTLNKNIAIVNGKEVTVQDAPYVKDDVCYLPMRFIMEASGYKVNWSQERNGIIMCNNLNQLFVSAKGDTVHPVEMTNGASYISAADLSNMGITIKIEGQSIIITED